jgi:hypothetical protein
MDKARTDNHNAYAARRDPIPEALRKRVEASLGRAVNEVGLTSALTSDRGEHDDGTVPLLLKPAGDADQRRDGSDVVHRRGVDGDRRIAQSLLLVA